MESNKGLQWEILYKQQRQSKKPEKRRTAHFSIADKQFRLFKSFTITGWRSKVFSVHRLVAIYFVSNDDPLEKNTVDHIDGNKQNNNAENLRWLSLSDNVKAYYNKMKEGTEYDNV